MTRYAIRIMRRRVRMNKLARAEFVKSYKRDIALFSTFGNPESFDMEGFVVAMKMLKSRDRWLIVPFGRGYTRIPINTKVLP